MILRVCGSIDALVVITPALEMPLVEGQPIGWVTTRDPLTRLSTSTPGLYPVGEGAGYAGGIMSAAIDGLRSAAALIRTHAPA